MVCRQYEVKICCTCGVARPLAFYGKDALRVDGLFPMCRPCRSQQPEQLFIRIVNKLTGSKLHYCPDCELWLPRGKFYSNKGMPSGISNQCKKCSILRASVYAKNNPEKRKESLARRLANPEYRHKKLVYEHQRREKVRAATNTLTYGEWLLILALQQNKCIGCGREFSFTLPPTKDHYIPVIRGGETTFINIFAACKSCNSRKQARSITYDQLYQEVRTYYAAASAD